MGRNDFAGLISVKLEIHYSELATICELSELVQIAVGSGTDWHKAPDGEHLMLS